MPSSERHGLKIHRPLPSRRLKHHKPSLPSCPACRGLASHQKPSSERHAHNKTRRRSNMKPRRPPRSRRRKHHKPRSYRIAQRAEVLHAPRRRPAKGTPLPCGVFSPADHHGAVGGNTISLAPIAAQRAEVLHATQRRPAKGTPLPCGVVSPADHHGAVGGNIISPAPIAAQRAEVCMPPNAVQRKAR
jgi:hypothetical protein